MKAQRTLAAAKSAASDYLRHDPAAEESIEMEQYRDIAHALLVKLPDHLDPHFIRFAPCLSKLAADVRSVVESVSLAKASMPLTNQHSSQHRLAVTRAEYSNLKRDVSLPLRCLAVKNRGENDTFITDPASIDTHLQKVWKPIRRGKIDQMSVILREYFRKYSQYLPKCQHIDVAPLSAEVLMEAAAASPNSSAGMDGFLPSDLKLMSPQAASGLAVILNAIEAGAPWPAELLHAKTAFIDKSKAPSFAADPLQLRILTITQAVYRLWGRARLAALAPWIQQWDDAHIFGGMPGRGAEDAWYSTALLQESIMLQGESFTAGSVDLMKCFDQLLRPLLYALLQKGNFPKPVLTAYRSFLENMQVHNVVCGHIGKSHRHACGIPQGCPLSMLMVAFLFRPWVNMVKTMSATPRILADDILVAAHGPTHFDTFTASFESTLTYIHDIGAAVAPDKSFLLSTNRVTRRSLRQLQWQAIGGAQIPVRLHVRDLGTHISTMERKVTTTLVVRAKQGVDILARLRATNFSYSKKAHICRSLVLPKSLYGVEACDLPVCLLDKLRASLARATNRGSVFQCNAILFEVASYGRDLDPYVQIVVRRVTALRRHIAKFPDTRRMFEGILSTYREMNFVGTDAEKFDSSSNVEAWRLPARGPVGLLLQSLASICAALTPAFDLHHAFSIPINILTLPWQALPNNIVARCSRSRFPIQTATRSEFGRAMLLDHDTLRLALKRSPSEDFRLLVSILGLGRWTEQRALKFDSSLDSVCRLCHGADGCLAHLLWDCPKLREHRVDDRHDFRDLQASDIHPLLRYGLPPPMLADTGTVLWEDVPEQRSQTSPLHTQYDLSAIEVPPGLHGYLLAVKEKMRQERYADFSAAVVAEYTKKVDLRDLAESLRKHLDQPFPCSQGKVPEVPNAFSDGSVTSPSQQLWATASFGVVHMRNISSTNELNELEQDYTHATVRCDPSYGPFYTCHAPFFGGYYSSTRAELAGALFALSVTWPIHLSLDNMSVVQTLNGILACACQSPRRPWSLQANGDLLELLHAVLVWRGGQRTTVISWCKGHADDSHIEAGLTDTYKQWGNNIADQEAELAHSMVSDCENACCLFRQRQHKYVDLLVSIHAMFVRVIRAEKVIRNQHVAKMSKMLKLRLPHRDLSMLQARPITMPSCPESHGGVLMTSALDLDCVNALGEHDRKIHNFICNCRWVVPGPYNSLGTSWVELFIAYAAHGGSLQCADNVLKTPTINQAVKEFRTRVKRIVILALPPEFHNCFQPYGISFIRLRSLGIATLLPGIQGKLCMSQPLRKYVSTILVSVAHKLPQRRAEAAIDGSHPLHPARFPLRRRLDILHHPPKFGTADTAGLDAHAVMPKPAYFHISCPHCSTSQNAANRKLHGSTGWLSLPCKRCGKSSRARFWKCTCGVAWTSCSKHQSHGYACVGHVRRNEAIRSPSHKRVLQSRMRSRAARSHLGRRLVGSRRHPRHVPRIGASTRRRELEDGELIRQRSHSICEPQPKRLRCLLEDAALSGAQDLPPLPQPFDPKASECEPVLVLPPLRTLASAKRRRVDDVIADARLRPCLRSAPASSSLSHSLTDSISRLLS